MKGVMQTAGGLQLSFAGAAVGLFPVVNFGVGGIWVVGVALGVGVLSGCLAFRVISLRSGWATQQRCTGNENAAILLSSSQGPRGRNWIRSWRDDAASDRQKSFADELGIVYSPDIGKGALSDLIDAAKQKRDNRRTSDRSARGVLGCGVILIAVVSLIAITQNQKPAQRRDPPSPEVETKAAPAVADGSTQTVQPAPKPDPAPNAVPAAGPLPTPANAAHDFSPAAVQETDKNFRTWTDSTGDYTTEAKFCGVAYGTVKLLKKDGLTVELPLEKLSEEDRQWIHDRKLGRAR
jgi:hypothetical protein